MISGLRGWDGTFCLLCFLPIQTRPVIVSRDKNHNFFGRLIGRSSNARIELLFVFSESASTLNLQWAVLIPMIQAATPITKVCLKDTQVFSPLSKVITLPLHKGSKISIFTLTLIKLSPLLIFCFDCTNNLAYRIAYIFSHCGCHEPILDIMDLYPNHQFFKHQIAH